MLLKPQLEQISQNFQDTLPKTYLEAFEKGIQELKQTNLAQQALALGDILPSFQLPDANGQPIDAYQLLEHSKLIISFYRGGWCPYCNLELLTLKQYLDEFEKAPAKLIAISPQTPDESLSTQEKHNLAFPVLSDHNNQVARKFGLVFSLSDALAKIYLQLGFDLARTNGTDLIELPLAATYVIDQSGVIRYAFVEEDYRIRAEPEEILYAVRTC